MSSDLAKDFDARTIASPVRCMKCNRMQPRGTVMFAVSSSAHFYDTDGYARLSFTSRQDSHRSYWCGSCVERTRSIKDDFVLPTN